MYSNGNVETNCDDFERMSCHQINKYFKEVSLICNGKQNMHFASQKSTDQHGSLQFSPKFQNYFRMYYKIETEALTPEVDCHQRKDTIFLSKKPDSH